MFQQPNLLLNGALVTMLLPLALAGCGQHRVTDPPSASGTQRPTATSLELAHASYAAGDLLNAEQSIREAMIEAPDDPAVLVLASRITADLGQFRQALKLASGVGPDSPHAEAAGSVIADVAIQRKDDLTGYEDIVWVAMESTLSRSPGRDEVRHALVELLNRWGYRHRACEHIDWLCRVGRASQEEMQAIISRRDSFPPLPRELTSSALSELMSQAGPLAIARAQYTAHRFAEAYKTLSPQLIDGWKHPEQAALFGEILAEKQAFEEMASWLGSCPQSVTRYSHYWSALGIWMMFEEEYGLAAGALLAAIEIDPTWVADYKRLGFCLSKLGDQDASQQIVYRSKQVSSLRGSARSFRSHPQYVNFHQLVATRLNELGRPLEFIRWKELVHDRAKEPAKFLQELAQQRTRLLSIPDFDAMTIQHRRMGLTRQQFPAPQPTQIERVVGSGRHANRLSDLAVDIKTDQTDTLIAYADVAGDVGIQMQYLNRSPPAMIGFQLHQTLGGGVAVLDYDLDGRPELYCGQGSGQPPDQSGQESNRFFRNLGSRYVEQTAAAELEDYGYTTGLAAGDVNQDGFTDLFVGALEKNRLLINQGDGTFTEGQHLLGDVEALFTASVAIADVTGDHLPDLIETNYVDVEKLFEPRVVLDGIPTSLSPMAYGAARDRLYTSTDRGAFVPRELETDGQSAANSLGVMVTDIDSSPGNEIFISNDVHPNRYWARASGRTGLAEIASLAGLALDYSGTATAGMGIAAGDFDGNGRLDLHVTNFWQESSSLYLQSDSGLFSDLAPRYGFDALTHQMLGFGTQALDIDRDGGLDLVILNGHIEDFSVMGYAFRMRPQILVGTGRRFEERSVDDPGNYWTTKKLGRALAKLDWNRDGRIDLAAVHLDEPVALLENRTDTPGHWLRLRLVGTSSERDAIGARVTIDCGGRQWTRWRTSGDGYLCTSESYLDFGIGGATKIDQLTVHWPSGSQEVIKEIAADRCYLLIEGDGITQE